MDSQTDAFLRRSIQRVVNHCELLLRTPLTAVEEERVSALRARAKKDENALTAGTAQRFD